MKDFIISHIFYFGFFFQTITENEQLKVQLNVDQENGRKKVSCAVI